MAKQEKEMVKLYAPALKIARDFPRDQAERILKLEKSGWEPVKEKEKPEKPLEKEKK